ncbi:MAG: hypothetical protein JW731_06085 [Bacteroidales bacterium]|nr:hypothetical protein [Bacteroidales bacterium]
MKTIIGILAFFFAFTFTVHAQDKTEIKVSDLPQAITQDLSQNHSGWQAEKAYKLDTKGEITYKVVVKSSKEDKRMKFTYDENGKLLNKEAYQNDKTKSDMNKKNNPDQSAELEGAAIW